MGGNGEFTVVVGASVPAVGSGEEGRRQTADKAKGRDAAAQRCIA